MQIKYYEDIDYTIAAESGEAHVDFLVYRGDAGPDDGVCNTDMKPYFEGYIKWDGCSNWNIPPGNFQLHFCGLKPTRDFGTLFERMYFLAAELLPKHKDEILFDKF